MVCSKRLRIVKGMKGEVSLEGPKEARALRLTTISLILLPLAHMTLDIFHNVFPIALPLFRESWRLSYTQVGLVMTVLNVTASVSQPIFGVISDRWGAQWFIPVGLAWTGIMISFLGFIPAYPLLLMLVFSSGLGSGAFHPSGLKAMADAAASKRGLANAIFMLGGNLGFALGPVVGSLLFLNLGLESSLVLVLPALVLGFTLWQFRRFYSLRPAPTFRPLSPESSAGVVGGLVVVCVIVVVRSWVHMGITTFFPLFIQSQGFGLAFASKLLFVFLVSGAIGGLVGGYLSDVLGRKKVILTCLISFTPLMLLFLKAPVGGAGALFLVLAGVAIFAPFSVMLTLAQELIPRRTGLASGLVLGLGFGVGGIGVSISGIISDLYGVGTSMYVMASLPLLGIPLVSFIKERASA